MSNDLDIASAALALSGGGGKLLLLPVIRNGRTPQRRLIREALIVDVLEDDRGTMLTLATTEILQTSLSFDEVQAMMTPFL